MTSPLTSKQAEVAALIAEGLSSKEIGEKLFLSVPGVESCRKRIRDKLDLKNGQDLGEYLRSTGWYL